MYSLDCSCFDKEFGTGQELIDYVIANGMDPNYEITRDGNATGDSMVDHIMGQDLDYEVRDVILGHRKKALSSS